MFYHMDITVLLLLNAIIVTDWHTDIHMTLQYNIMSNSDMVFISCGSVPAELG